MSNPLRTPEDYELFLYTLAEQFPAVRGSTLTLVRRGASLARVSGELTFDNGIRLIVRQRILYDRLPAVIDSYGYEVWQGEQKRYWYDSRNRTLTMRRYRALIPTTSMCLLISNTIGSPRRG
jgi:hypothetical protein